MLEVVRTSRVDEALLAGWRARVARARAHLRLARAPGRRGAACTPAGASLAIAAPCDQLFLATEVNEWALVRDACRQRDPARTGARFEAALLRGGAGGRGRSRRGHRRRCWRSRAALARFARLAAREARPALRRCSRAAAARGAAARARRRRAHARRRRRRARLSARRAARRRPACPGASCTTSRPRSSPARTARPRRCACSPPARARTAGRAAYSCTDGVFFDGETLGQRRLLRARRRTRAVLRERRAARRRSSRPRAAASCGADSRSRARTSRSSPTSAPITSASTASTISTALADVKLDRRRRARAGGPAGAECRRCAAGAPTPDSSRSASAARRRSAGLRSMPTTRCCAHIARAAAAPAACAPAACVLQHHGQRARPRASSTRMPLTVDGSATYNIANLAGAALAAAALGIAARRSSPRVRALRREPRRQPRAHDALRARRRCRYCVDYAHNPDGLRGLLQRGRAPARAAGPPRHYCSGMPAIARTPRSRRCAGVAADFRPDLVVVKENEAHLRGREPGEVPRIIHAALLRAGLPEAALPMRKSELEAVRLRARVGAPGRRAGPAGALLGRARRGAGALVRRGRRVLALCVCALGRELLSLGRPAGSRYRGVACPVVPLRVNSNLNSHCRESCSSAGANFHFLAASFAKRAKYELGPGFSRSASLTLPERIDRSPAPRP